MSRCPYCHTPRIIATSEHTGCCQGERNAQGYGPTHKPFLTDPTPNHKKYLVDGPAVYVDLRQIQTGHGDGCTYGAHTRIVEGYQPDGTELWRCKYCEAGVRAVVKFDREMFAEEESDGGMWLAAAAGVTAIALIIGAIAVGAWMIWGGK